MAQQTINLGTTDNDGTGDTLKAGGGKINDNFTELYSDRSPKTEVETIVNHGTDATVARPTGYARVRWIGTVQPNNIDPADVWENPDDGAPVENGGSVATIQKMTQAEYDALGTPDATTLYVIVG